ncbi:hypothetical protein CFOL_v3_09134 [Cephalotus follicularis]|uniref:Uncharacterized protein n=1 Tax=Cephalotus follicularis TaxID=3775 RepID=A0A1Q3BCH1_CEPFO|nr:hypothetical protein CFOL_v3_09134 [Cephalotus follicularis]
MPGCSLQDDAIVRELARSLSSEALVYSELVCKWTSTFLWRGYCFPRPFDCFGVISSISPLSPLTIFIVIVQPECCKSLVDRSGGGANDTAFANCMCQALIEYIISLKFSTIN